MWEAISRILTSPYTWQVLLLAVVLVFGGIVLVKTGTLSINTKHVSLGTESKEQYYERKIIQEQCDFTHTYLMGLVGKITAVCPDHTLLYGGWFTRCILEDAYDEFVKWITFNHITADESYISTKQKKICALVYNYAVRPEFKTQEFQERMNRWVSEIITELVRIRKVYTEQMKKER